MSLPEHIKLYAALGTATLVLATVGRPAAQRDRLENG